MLPISTEKLHKYYTSCGGQVCTDTRHILPGSLFFCLKGGNFDGNQFAHEALKRGAAYAVADDPAVVTDSRILPVGNVLEALQQLAAYHRDTLKNTVFLAIGGSNGKTTTKELCSAVLGSFKRVKATAGNLNNHIGVPLTILGIHPDTEVAIIEMGTNHPGEMKVLCDITRADMGIVTNVGKEHLEGFGDIEAVAREESELYLQLMEKGGHAIINADDHWLGNMSKRLTRKTSVSLNGSADLTASLTAEMPHLRFTAAWQGQPVGSFEARLGGSYNLYNILSAVAAGIALGGDAAACFAEACAFQPTNNRSEWREQNGRNIWLDAYNANPSSVEAALRSFAGMPGSKAVFLGDMLELGAHTMAEHQAIFRLCQELGFDEIYLCGPAFRAAAQGYPLCFDNHALLTAWLHEHPVKSASMLIKGSRGMKMESVLEAI